MNPFELRRVGRTRLKVPVLGLGTAPLSGMSLIDGLYGGTNVDIATSIINHAYDLGINFFDTAPLYGTGKAEYRLSLSKLPTVNRNSFVLSTKVGRIITPDTYDRSENFEDLNNLTAKNSWTEKDIMKSFEQSLVRLDLNKIDILYVHDPDMEKYGEEQAIKEAFPTLIKLKDQGLVSAIGCGMNQWEMAYKFVEMFNLDVILLAGRYTLLDHSAYYRFLPLCKKNNVSIVIGGPYNSGILAKDLSKTVTFDYEIAPSNLVNKAKLLSAICLKHSVNMKSAALQFVLAHPAIVSVIPGVESISELEENLDMIKTDIPISLWDELKNEMLIPEDAPVPN